MALSSSKDEHGQQEYLRGANLHLHLHWQHISTFKKIPLRDLTTPPWNIAQYSLLNVQHAE